jgi:3-methyladenine DNA glycosylase
MTVCSWAFGEKENMQVYHAKEWGKETHDERLLFEMLSLELMQAGLSWQTVLDKRQAFKDDFCDFDTEKIGQLTSDEINQIIQDPRIIRNKRKIDAIINNAKIVEQWHKQGNSLDDFFGVMLVIIHLLAIGTTPKKYLPAHFCRNKFHETLKK